MNFGIEESEYKNFSNNGNFIVLEYDIMQAFQYYIIVK